MKNNQYRTGRKPALSSIGLAVIATLIASGAQAADTSYDFGTSPVANANGHQTVNVPLDNSGVVNAQITNGNAVITTTGGQTDSSNTLSSTLIDANAIGNLAKPVDTSINLSLIMGSANQGAATLLHSTNSANVSSLVDQNSVLIDVTGFQTGSAVNKDNTISARTAANQGTSSIAGSVPNGYASGTPGSASIATVSGSTTSAAEGTLVVTTAQESNGAQSSATASGNDVTLKLTANNAPYKVASGAALTGNTVSASTQVNSSASTIDIQANTAPSFTGSAVVSNTQLGVNAPALAGNYNTAITAAVTGTDTTAAGEMGGALAVTGNRISSAATGNETLGSGTSPVGNRILLANGLAFAGGGAATPGANLQGYAAGTAVSADFLIANTQSNQTVGNLIAAGSVLGETIGGAVRANVDSLVNGAVNLSTNSISSNATGNAASSAIASGTDRASFASSVALANQQDNNRVSVNAVNTNSAIEATVGGVIDSRAAAGDAKTSSVSVNSNRSSADARGNEVGQSLSLDATTLALGSANATLNSTATQLDARGTATVSNRQVNDNAPVSAQNNASSIGQRDGTLTGPMLMVNGNVQEAVALGNNASNQVALTGNTVGSGAGILSLQRTEAGGDIPTVASSVTASLSGARAFIDAGNGNVNDGVTGSTLKLTNNRQDAVAYGNRGDNAMVATGNTLAAPATSATSGPASSVRPNFGSVKPLSGTVVAAYGVLNDQAVLADVSARAVTTDASADVLVTGPLSKSSVLNDANTLASEAYGNFGQSSLTLNPVNLNSTGASSVGNVTSLQTVSADITARAAAQAVALTTITGSVGSTAADTGSSVSTSGNRLDAQATGSQAANALNVNATNIATVAASARGANVSGGAFNTNASFSVQNAQLGNGNVTATLRDIANPALPSDVRIAIGGDVTGSSVVADSNVARVSATSNNASNALAIKADSNLASSSALQNGQLTNANVDALIGAAGTLGTPFGPGSVYANGASAAPVLSNDVTYVSGTGALSVAAGKTLVFTLGAASPADKTALGNYLTSLGFVVDLVANTATVAGGTTVNVYTLNNVTQGVSGGNSTYSFSGFTSAGTPAVAAVPQLGGVSLAVAGDIIRSTLSVDGNTSYGVVKGNAATNSTSVKGSTVEAGSNSAVASANDAFAGNTQQRVLADHSLSNLQAVGVLGSSSLQSNVYGNFVIDGQPGATISNSSLSVSGNQQMAEARANIASNTLALEGTAGLKSVSALQSVQLSGAAVSALSNMQLSAPSSITESTLKLSDNSNIALAVINDATNTLTAKGSNVGTSQAANISIGGTFGASVTAEHLLANQQLSTTNVTSTALTSLTNQEYVAGTGTGNAIRSTLSILNNVTAAEATANTAFNTVDVTGAASQTASAALRNLQNSSSDATASATSIAGIALPATGATVALNSSSVLLNGNSTTALARGNNATNVLNSLAGSAYGVASNGSVVSNGTNLGVYANAGILNSQNNSGAVSATVADTYNVVAMNSVGSPAITGSSVSVTGNQVAAQAYGNSVVNQVTLNALNTGSPTSAVGSYQSNSGAVTAAVDTVFFGAGTLVSGGVTGSTMRVNGNQITASAIGNSSVSSILAR